jgi:DNA-binding NtrC family response regulator
MPMSDAQFATLKEPIPLVVDDEPLILMDASNIISDAGYAVVEAGSVDEAFDFLQRHASLQLRFTDVQTPGEMNGFALAGEVAERWPHICVVVASGAAVPAPGDLPDKARFINKPFSASLVLETIREFCRGL